MFADRFRSSSFPQALNLGSTLSSSAPTGASADSEKSQNEFTTLLAQYSVPLALMSRGHSVGPAMGYRMFELFIPGVVTTLSPAPEVPFAASALCGLAEALWDAAVGLNGKRGDCMFMVAPRSELVSEALRCARACQKVLGDHAGLVRARLDAVLFCCLLTEGVVNNSNALATVKVRFWLFTLNRDRSCDETLCVSQCKPNYLNSQA